MSSYSIGDIRNTAILGHMGAGKTTLVDAMVSVSGAVKRKGSVQDGTSLCDFEKEEKDHQHSIFASVLHVNHDRKRINVIDTPGSPDLMGQAILALPAVETAVVVINASSGIELLTRRMMEKAKTRNLARVVVINKMDSPEADLKALILQIQETFGSECLPINLPTGERTGVVDCLSTKSGTSDIGDLSDYNSGIMDQIIEMNEELMEKYLGGGEVTLDELHETLLECLNEGHLVPICFTNAHDDVGVSELMTVLTNYCPNPVEGNKRPFLVGQGENEQKLDYSADPEKSLLAHVFRVATDPFVGKLVMFRVHQGTAHSNMQVSSTSYRKPIKLNRLLSIQGKEHHEVDTIIAGDIGCVAKIEDLHTDDVMYTDDSLGTVHLRPLVYPTPMFGLAVEPTARGDEAKISGALTRLQEEDPTFKVTHDHQTKELIINGLGELHLRIVLERLKNRYNLQVATKSPKIAYRETITIPANGHHRHKKQTGGAGQFGEVYLKIEPLERGEGNEFVDAIFGGAIPHGFLPAIEKGARELLNTGFVAGYPIQDLRVTITDGKHHPVDSKEVAFKTAGKYAVRDAISKARPVVLEPIVSMEVIAPEEAMGSITGDLSGRRGRVQGTDMLPGGMILIRALVPLGEVSTYQSMLKSVTAGQGSFMMELSHYDPVPPNVQQQLAAAFKPQVEEE